ncbi:MAG: D-2-hydroxyacid dehydrogenase, partial [Beijerinckiaceae bacterium]
YQLAAEYRRRRAPAAIREATTLQELEHMVGDLDVLVVSGFWRNAMLERAPKLRFIQSVSAGTDQYDKVMFRTRGIRLASAQGANERAVAEHALALMLALSRYLHLGRDAQAARRWRPMIADPVRREQEQGGRNVVVVGFGRIGQRLGRLAKTLGCHVTGVRRDAAPAPDCADVVIPVTRLGAALAHADCIVLTCPLTPETERLINAAALRLMKPSAHLINVSRGRVVDEAALVAALFEGRIAAAALDVTEEEPLPESSPLWTMPNVIITPHSAGETGRYEENVIDLLIENLGRLGRGETELLNGVV